MTAKVKSFFDVDLWKVEQYKRGTYGMQMSCRSTGNRERKSVTVWVSSLLLLVKAFFSIPAITI